MDERFDRLGSRLVKKVWSGPKGQIRRAVILRDLKPVLASQMREQKQAEGVKTPRLIDLGCGPGVLAAEMASLGYQVDVCDISQEMMESTQKRLRSHQLAQGSIPRGQAWLGSFHQIPWDRGQWDLVFSHGVLGWLEHPQDALKEIWSFLRPGAYLSLLVFNPWRWALRKGKFGHWDALQTLKPDIRKGRKLTPPNAPLITEIERWAKDLGALIHSRSGVRIFYEPNKEQNCFDQKALEMELKYSREEPFCQIGMHTHWLMQKKDPTEVGSKVFGVN